MAATIATPAGKLGAVCVAESDEVLVFLRLRGQSVLRTARPDSKLLPLPWALLGGPEPWPRPNLMLGLTLLPHGVANPMCRHRSCWLSPTT